MPSFNNNKNSNNGEGPGGGNIVPRPPAIEISEPRCNVCRSLHRRAIDQLMMMGVTFAELARQFESEGISRRSLSNHKERHMSVTDKAVRLILEEQQRAMGEDVENTKKHIITRQTVIDTAIYKGHLGIVSGEIPIEARDLVQFINLREKMAEKTASIQMEEMQKEFAAFAQAVKAEIPESFYDAIMKRFDDIMAKDNKIIDTWGMEVPQGMDLELPSLENPLQRPVDPPPPDDDEGREDSNN